MERPGAHFGSKVEQCMHAANGDSRLRQECRTNHPHCDDTNTCNYPDTKSYYSQCNLAAYKSKFSSQPYSLCHKRCNE